MKIGISEISTVELPPNSPGESTAVLVTYVIGRGWQLTTINDGCVYTPRSYEATFGVLPACPKGSSYTRKERREWSAHQRKANYRKRKNKPHNRKGEG